MIQPAHRIILAGLDGWTDCAERNGRITGRLGRDPEFAEIPGYDVLDQVQRVFKKLTQDQKVSASAYISEVHRRCRLDGGPVKFQFEVELELAVEAIIRAVGNWVVVKTETPRTDRTLRYLHYQFPATVGHRPLREMIEGPELESNRLLTVLKKLYRDASPTTGSADAFGQARDAIAEAEKLRGSATKETS